MSRRKQDAILGFSLLALPIAFLLTFIGTAAMTVAFWLTLDPKVLVLFRPPTPDETHDQHLMAITMWLVPIGVAIFTTACIYTRLNRWYRQNSGE